MMWFEALTGFPEKSPQQTRENISVCGNTLTSHINGKVLVCGELETPSLAELRECVHSSRHRAGRISVREVVANVQNLHTNESNAGSLFQVASQFNLLEMVSPSVTPEHGVGIYENDPTHGLADIGAVLRNSESRRWEMRNGYALASHSGLVEISNRLRASTESELDGLRQLLRIGIQWNTQVTLNESKHMVSQVYCSALPVAYSHHSSSLWAEFARLVLEASYEATICAAILNSTRNGNNRLFLTLLGGGAFGNEIDWIIVGIQRALNLYQRADLDVAIVSYGSSNQNIRQVVVQAHN